MTCGVNACQANRTLNNTDSPSCGPDFEPHGKDSSVNYNSLARKKWGQINMF